MPTPTLTPAHARRACSTFCATSYRAAGTSRASRSSSTSRCFRGISMPARCTPSCARWPRSGPSEATMSLDGFQQAFAHFVASPARCLALRADPALLESFALDARERERLLAMVRHPGMSHHCTLYRANRLTAIARSLPRTCQQLGTALSDQLDRFWASSTEAELQFRREA